MYYSPSTSHAFKVVRRRRRTCAGPPRAERESRPGGLPQDRQRLLDVGHLRQPGPGQLRHAAGRVVGLTKTLAKEWGQFKINCNAVAFGFVDTRLTQSKVDDNAMEIDGEGPARHPDQIRQMASATIPLGRAASPEEAAGPVFFLCTPWSNYVHGQTLHHRRADGRDERNLSSRVATAPDGVTALAMSLGRRTGARAAARAPGPPGAGSAADLPGRQRPLSAPPRGAAGPRPGRG